MKELLPIGSVVLLKGGEKRVMVCGLLQNNVETGTIYDYSACLFPEGIIDSKNMYLFNNSDIERLYFIGFQDTEEISFMKNVYEKLGLTSDSDETAKQAQR